VALKWVEPKRPDSPVHDVADNHLWGIWCEIRPGNVNGHRGGWLKCGDGGYETFCTRELAQARVEQLEHEHNGNPHRIATYVFLPVKVSL
jgi:hypothetical protein